jgi:hypothetical protein
MPKVSLVPVPPPNNVLLGRNRQSVLPDDGAVGFMFPTKTAAPDPVSDLLNRRVVVQLICPRRKSLAPLTRR